MLPKDSIKDFKKLCVDVNKIRNLFKKPKYVSMIGFDLDMKVYYTPINSSQSMYNKHTESIYDKDADKFLKSQLLSE